jgi:hypothetical protein
MLAPLLRPTRISTTLPTILLLASIPQATAFSLSDWLNNPPYSNGATVQEQIQCYTMPYGGIGFASHLLTYLTVTCLALGRSPVFPWIKLQHRIYNICLAATGLVATVILATLGILRCRKTWPFLLLAVWKLVLSVTLSAMTIHAAVLIQRPHESYRSLRELRKAPGFVKILYWLFLYAAGAIVGLTGMGQLVRENFADLEQLRIITYVFVAVASAIPAASLIAGLVFLFSPCWNRPGRYTNLEKVETDAEHPYVSLGFVILALMATVLGIGALFAFYSDWALAALAGDLAGTPSSDNAILYWSYFAFKRLPLFSL